MSVKATSWAWAQHNIGAMPKLVLVALADFANAEGKCWPGQAELVWMTDSSVRTVRRNLDVLVDAGLIERIKRGSPASRGGRVTDCYQLAIEDPGHAVTGQIGRSSYRPNEGGLPATSGRSTQSVVNRQEPSGGRTRLDPMAFFEEFWSVYPNRAGRGEAEKRWKLVLAKGVKPADLIAGARRYAAETDGTERRFIRHAATWLNNDGWRDEPVLPAFQNGQRPAIPVVGRLDPPDALIAEWSAAGVPDEKLPARIRAWREEVSRTG